MKAVEKSKISPALQETVQVVPHKQKFTQVLKMADLGVYLDQPLGFRTFRNDDNSKKQLKQDNEYITYKNNAFAPLNHAQAMAKIQSLENFFKNESLYFSKTPSSSSTTERNSKGINEVLDVKSYAPIRASNVINMPPSLLQNYEAASEFILKTPGPGGPDSINYMFSHKDTPSIIAGFSKQEFRNRLSKSQREPRRQLKSQEQSYIKASTKYKDTVKILENLLSNPHRPQTVASARSRTMYRKKPKLISPKQSPQISKNTLTKKEGFF